MRMTFFVILALVALFSVRADLPMHCEREEVFGVWDFTVGDEITSHANAAKFDCGLAAPKTAAAAEKPFVARRNMTVKLSFPYVAEDLATKKQGTWTMVYDEGMEIRIGGKKYFAYFKYQLDGKYCVSTCSETVNGYVHGDDESAWGCWRGKRRGEPIVRRAKPPDDGEEETKREAEEQAIEQHQVNVDEKYKPEHDFVDAINALELGFSAKVYPQFSGKTMKQLRRMAGAHKPKPMLDTPVNLLQTADDEAAAGKTKSKYSLPKSWDWRNVSGKNYLLPAIDQGDCGSCYAVATADMITARVAVQTNNSVRVALSAQEILGCGAKWNQGCDGGFPFLSSKYVADFGLTSEICYPYEERGFNAPEHYPKCMLARDQLVRPDACKYRVTVSKYDYIGGCYGCCSEEGMMKEIYENGPIVAAFKVNEALMHYSDGVFLELDESDMPKALNRWEETNHAVLVVGWGVNSKGKKYWTVKNSWGRRWGQDGYFFVERGTDVMAFESMAVAALPVVSDAMHVHARNDLLKTKVV
jgi:cathepsin C